MFTGIISETGTIKTKDTTDSGVEFQIHCTFAAETEVDESISVNGTCLTVVEKDRKTFKVQCVEETLRKTSLGSLEVGDEVNLERSLFFDQTIQGHIVQGHVDTLGTVEKVEDRKFDRHMIVSFPEKFSSYIVGRGSVAIDGISLTVSEDEENRFSVAVIPYTWENTNLKNRKKGDKVNLEFDIFGKYIVKHLEERLKRRERGDNV